MNRVDINIVASYKLRAIEAIPQRLSVADSNECAFRLLEVVEIQAGEDGELYAREAKEVLVRLETASGSTLPVLETAIEMLLFRVRNGRDSSLSAFHIQMDFHSRSFVSHRLRRHPSYGHGRIKVAASSECSRHCRCVGHRVLRPISSVAYYYTRGVRS